MQEADAAKMAGECQAIADDAQADLGEITTVNISGTRVNPVNTTATMQAYCEIRRYIAVRIRKEGETIYCPVCQLWLSEG